jgi:uncharacterized protein (UPF0548 family)
MATVQFLLPWQKPDLDRWRHRAIHPLASRQRVPSPYHDCMALTLAVESPGEPEPGGPFERLEKSVLAYRVFGRELALPVVETSPVEVGDTIGLVYRFHPFLRLFFASRVTETFVREPSQGGWRSGFAYQTLEGHPELGEEVFEVIKDAGGAVSFRLEAWSRPNLWLVRLFTFWARAIQKSAAQSAAAHLVQVAELESTVESEGP